MADGKLGLSPNSWSPTVLGEKGDAGNDGREVELQNTGTWIQWRYVGEAAWTNLVSVAALQGAQGAQGEQGIQGVPGAAGANGTNGTNGAAGVVQAVIAGTGVTVDSTDPANPIVNAAGGSGTVESVVAGTGISIDDTDPANPIISATGASPLVPPLLSDFSWVNQGTTTASDTSTSLVITPQNDNFVHALVKAAPTAPYSVYINADFNMLASAESGHDNQLGIVLRDSTDGEMVTFGMYMTSLRYPAIMTQRWTSATAWSSNLFTYISSRDISWFRVDVTSTTITFFVSGNGETWFEVGSAETISSFVDAINQIGIVARTNSGAAKYVGRVNYFSTTAPSIP